MSGLRPDIRGRPARVSDSGDKGHAKKTANIYSGTFGRPHDVQPDIGLSLVRRLGRGLRLLRSRVLRLRFVHFTMELLRWLLWLRLPGRGQRLLRRVQLVRRRRERWL